MYSCNGEPRPGTAWALPAPTRIDLTGKANTRQPDPGGFSALNEPPSAYFQVLKSRREFRPRKAPRLTAIYVAVEVLLQINPGG
ncbi:MAG TPA: hypothetical protein ENF27_01820 [Chloroflexi bacterium]|nr:hypothetical protein [Chloroflexota bacterium]